MRLSVDCENSKIAYNKKNHLYTEREREKERERERERDTHTHTERQSESEREKEAICKKFNKY